MKRSGPVQRFRAPLGHGLAALAIAAGLAFAPSPAVASPQGGSGGEAGRARELFKKGREEYARDHLPQAYALFLEAWGLQKTGELAGNLALVEHQLGRYRDACDHATFAIANFPPGGSDAQHHALEDVLAKARGFVAVLTVRTSVVHATVTLDGQALTLPVPGTPGEMASVDVFVEPGPHALLATAPGCDPAADSVRAEKGGNHLVTLAPVCGAKVPPVPPTPPKPPEPPPGPRPLTVAGFVTFGVGVGVGAALAVVSKVKANDADTQGAHLAPNACATAPHSSACTTLHDLRTSQGAFANAALWTFVGAGAVGVGTLIYTLVAPRRDEAASGEKAGAAKPAARLVPVAGPAGASLLLEGTF